MRLMAFPRLLPATILAMAALLVVKSVDLVRAAAPAAAGASQHPAATAAAEPAAKATPATDLQPAALPDTPPSAAMLPDTPPSAAMSPSERNLLLDLRRRNAQLDAREAALTSRQAVLAAAETRLVARADELATLQTRLEALDSARKGREAASWAELTKLYETMKPADAAAIFDDLDMNVLLELVDRMKPAKAAPVLAAMQPPRARLLTAELAEWRARRDAPPQIGRDAPPQIGRDAPPQIGRDAPPQIGRDAPPKIGG